MDKSLQAELHASKSWLIQMFSHIVYIYSNYVILLDREYELFKAQYRYIRHCSPAAAHRNIKRERVAFQYCYPKFALLLLIS